VLLGLTLIVVAVVVMIGVRLRARRLEREGRYEVLDHYPLRGVASAIAAGMIVTRQSERKGLRDEVIRLARGK